MKIDKYYIDTQEVINEEDNGIEHTYFIKGRISKNGQKWEDCIFIWNGDMYINRTNKKRGLNKT
jgi:hypothetical protein